jgi:hypothetical protein
MLVSAMIAYWLVSSAESSGQLLQRRRVVPPAQTVPAPSGKFILMLRLYWPKERSPSIINGTWKVPPVKKLAP